MTHVQTYRHIPCTYTQADWQTFRGLYTRTSYSQIGSKTAFCIIDCRYSIFCKLVFTFLRCQQWHIHSSDTNWQEYRKYPIASASSAADAAGSRGYARSTGTSNLAFDFLFSKSYVAVIRGVRSGSGVHRLHLLWANMYSPCHVCINKTFSKSL